MTRRDASSAGSALRIRLDPVVPWEALLARHLEGLSAGRRQRRARELLVAGFREECWVRSQLHQSRAGWRPRQQASSRSEPATTPTDTVAPSRPLASKPLTALAKVIG